MPVTSPQGTLDFKKVDKITFVGASSNTVIDTTTGSVGIGVVGDALSSNLHVVGDTRMEGNINMLHTSNTASIKLNSNVVTEFPRSKKLIKYPRVALTQNALNNGYTASASDEQPNYEAWRAFENLNTNSDAWSSDFAENRYDASNGEATTNTPLFEGEHGDWIQIQLPTKIKLEYVVIHPRRVGHQKTPEASPGDGRIFGSTDGTNWTLITSFSNRKYGGDASNENATAETVVTSTYVYYNYYRLQVTKRAGQYGTDKYVAIGQLEYYGVPEYDPEAHGTDVVVKSEANVPNTDWLEVYYDAKNYTNGVVQDETANNRDGTLYGNTSLNSADGIHKFDFDGNGDYIKTTLTGFTGTTVTFSLWVFIDSIAAGRANTLMAIGSWNPNAATFCAIDSNGLFELGTHSITNVKAGPAAVGEWVHLTGIAMSNNYRIYKNGQLISSNSDSGSINYGTNPVLYLATRANSSGNPEATRYTDCKIANARLFNRALTTDEIYQLYAYQKEYFGYGDLSMTLKAGRLGIGTSEPRAALDVRGRIMREYNPGEIIEEINTVCNGRPVTVQSGTYTPTNVTSSQTSSHTHTEINGSNITYSKPAGAKRIYYKFACHWEDAGNGALTNFKIQIYHNGAWQDINPSRYLHSAQYQNDGNNHGSMWVINEYIFECDADTESQHDGYFLSSKTSYTFRVVWRHHGTSGYESILHQNDWWDGTSTNILHPPQLTIRAIA
jgi:hypothetical protein